MVNLYCQLFTPLHETGLFAGRYCEVGFLRRNKDYFFGLCIPIASFSYKHYIFANTVPLILYPAAWNQVVCRPLLRCGLFAPKQGLHFWAVHTFSFFWYKHCIGANTVPWRKIAPNYRKFVLSALYPAVWNWVVYRPILRSGLLHWKKDYIFWLCIPLASFWFKLCISANAVPWRKLAPNYGKFVLSTLNGAAWNRVVCSPYCEVGFLHWNKNYIFGLCIPLVSFWYKHCIGANTVPWWKVPPNYRKFGLSALYPAAWNRVVYRPVLQSGLFAPKQGLHFWALHTLNFLLI